MHKFNYLRELDNTKKKEKKRKEKTICPFRVLRISFKEIPVYERKSLVRLHYSRVLYDLNFILLELLYYFASRSFH
jgi:hypothetical protein